MEPDKIDRDSNVVWIINPYGSLPSESWATYRSTMLAECLASNGYRVTQFISNFEHRSKTFRCEGPEMITVSSNYSISIIPSTPYSRHISMARIRYERRFAKNLLKAAGSGNFPDYVILAEPALFYYDILLTPLISKGKCKLVLDIIDIWPELFELAIPKHLRVLSGLILAPFYFWRKRLYKHASAIVAVANDYLNIAKRLTRREDVVFEVVYWSYRDSGIHAGITNQRVKALLAEKSEKEIWIVYAGTLGENYDINSIVQASKRLHGKREDGVKLKFVVAGDGPLRELCERSQSDNFVFLGRLASAELKLLYQHCDIALSTYKGESTVAMPIKAFDYISSGLPMVNSLGRDLGKLVEQRELGLNYDPYAADSLSNAINRLIFDSKFRNRCSENAFALAGEFAEDVQYFKFVKVLRRLGK